MENLLTDVARVKVQLQNPVLPSKRKKLLRREAILAYIRSKPYGHRITTPEFQAAGNFKAPSNAYLFVQRLCGEGVVAKHNIGPKSFFYTVPGELKTKTPAALAGLEAVADRAYDVPLPPLSSAPVTGITLHSVDSIEKKAMQYYWSYENDLPGFIKWLKSQENA